MAKPQHRTSEYRAAVKHWEGVVSTVGATCVEVICLMPTRDIPVGAARSTWHTAHDPSGTVVIGVSHRKCNESEAATRGNQMRAGTYGGRWAL